MCWESVCEKRRGCIVQMSHALWSARVPNTAPWLPFQIPIGVPFVLTLSTWFLALGILSGFVPVPQVYPFLLIYSVPPYSLHIHDDVVLWDLADGYCFGQEASGGNLVTFGQEWQLFIWRASYLFFPLMVYTYKCFVELNFSLVSITALSNVK